MRHPPFAKLMAERVRDPHNRQQSYWVLIGAESWDKAARWRQEPHRVFAICPPGEDPGAFNWSVYRGAPPPVGLVRCGEVDGDQLQCLVQAMLAAGSPRVFDLLVDAVYQRMEVAA